MAGDTSELRICEVFEMATTPYLKSVKPVSEQDAQKVATYNVLADDHDVGIAGMLTRDIAGTGAYTLTRVEALNPVIKFTGTLTGNRTISLPVSLGTNRAFIIWNATSGAFTVTVITTTGGSSGVVVTQGTKSLLAHDGTNVFNIVAGSGTGDALVGNPLSQFAATTSAQLAGVISDELGSGPLLFATAAFNDQTGTSYTLVTADNGKVVTLNNGSAITLTVPTGLGVGFNCLLYQKGAGQVTLSSPSATVNNRQGHTKLAGAHAVGSLLATAADVLVFGGDTSA